MEFPLFKKEIMLQEAAVFNNIGYCYHRDNQDKKVVEFTSKVIERAAYVTDVLVLIKALTRRGLAYQTMEKYKPSADDFS